MLEVIFFYDSDFMGFHIGPTNKLRGLITKTEVSFATFPNPSWLPDYK